MCDLGEQRSRDPFAAMDNYQKIEKIGEGAFLKHSQDLDWVNSFGYVDHWA